MNTTIQSNSTLRYLLILEDAASRRMITLNGAKYTLGRQNDNSIVLDSRKASRKHATLIKKSNLKNNKFSYWILDGDLDGNKSHNGIFVNGEKCLIHELKDGDLINFGCDINASYHIISNVTEAEYEHQTIESKIIHKSLAGEQNVHEKSTLILSDSHIDKSSLFTEEKDSKIDTKDRDDDTFHDQAYLDNLTGLPNQILFNEYFSIALANAKRNGNHLALLLVDIAQLNQINETYGLVIGNQVLQKMAETLNSCVRSSDIVARWTEDKFSILLPQLKEVENGEKIRKRIMQTTSQPIEMERFSITVTTHIVLVIYPQDGQDIKSLTERLEHNLQAKKQQATPSKLGVSSAQSSHLQIKSTRLDQIEGRLKNALDNKELKLCYQPQFNIETKQIEVMETLIRWQHPKKGLIYSRQFLPWLEKTTLLMPITQWILETACKQFQTWQNCNFPAFLLSINLSKRQLQHPDFLTLLEQVLTKTGLPPQNLELEITEQSILDNLELSRQVLLQLKELGVYLSLDNFGRGLVSIGYLQDFPFQKVKIEQSFIQNLAHEPEDTAMISALIALGKSFNLRVVAEGVETQQQLEILHNLGCKMMQGYYFSQPLNEENATDFLRLHNVFEEKQTIFSRTAMGCN